MAGPLMPQWVMSRVPVAVALLSAIRSFVFPATVPASEVRAVSSILRLYSEGMGCSVLCPVRASHWWARGSCAPPVATTMMSYSDSWSMSSIVLFVMILMLCRLASLRKVFIMVCESCVFGKMHWSSCVVRGMPCLSNQS